MTTTALIPSLGVSFLQSLSEKGEDRPKRPRGKNVSWPSEDKLCQVRLFAAEDAPSLSGTILQEFYQAKQTRFMHAAVPISLDDLPPGFEGVAAKRARLDAEAIAAMVPQIPWRCPAKFILDPSWQVAAGEESTEVSAQLQREVRVLEAVYPRASAIPPSPAEPPETPQDMDEAHILQIPLVPVEDEEEGMEEECLAPGTPFISLTDSVHAQYNKISPTRCAISSGQDSHKVGSGASVTSKVDQSLGTSFLKDADLNVAAAAAAAYAAVKATESGRMIDPGLLVKILSNPVLLETLSAASQRLKNPATEFIANPSNMLVANGSNVKLNAEQSAGGISKVQSMPITPSALHEGQTSAPEGRLLHGVQGPPRSVAWSGSVAGGGVTQERVFTALTAHEQSTGMGVGHVNGPFGMNCQPFGQLSVGPQVMTQAVAPPSSRPLAPRQDYLKELIQQHGMVKGINGHPTSVALDERNLNLNGERIRAMGVGPRPDSANRWLGNDQIHTLPLSPWNPRDDSGAEAGRIKPWKPCLYFNTPRGCRNGANCTFLHESSAEKKPERTRVDVCQPQQVKRPRVESASEVKDSSSAKM